MERVFPKVYKIVPKVYKISPKVIFEAPKPLGEVFGGKKFPFLDIFAFTKSNFEKKQVFLVFCGFIFDVFGVWLGFLGLIL